MTKKGLRIEVLYQDGENCNKKKLKRKGLHKSKIIKIILSKAYISCWHLNFLPKNGKVVMACRYIIYAVHVVE
ncbi:MAG: hypothetical protein DRJ36_02635 [Thermoprotei archaeon]|nr:MAG: hypothetical protein DRJ36_02635 [Thermoprotei archaeon]